MGWFNTYARNWTRTIVIKMTITVTIIVVI